MIAKKPGSMMYTIGETDRLIADFAAMSDEELAAFEAQRAQELAPHEVLVEARRTVAERFEPYGYRHIKSQHLLRKRVREISFRIYFYSSQHNQKGLFAFLSPTVGVGSQRLKSWRVKQRWSEVVLGFRPVFSLAKVDQDFKSGCHFHGFGFAGMDLVGGQDAVDRMRSLDVAVG